jgi:hypothetical protein
VIPTVPVPAPSVMVSAHTRGGAAAAHPTAVHHTAMAVRQATSAQHALQRQNTEILKQIFPEKDHRGLSPNFHIHASVGDLYIPTIGLPILLEEILYVDRYLDSINRSQTQECGNLG